MVDTLVLEASVARRESSSLSWGTKWGIGVIGNAVALQASVRSSNLLSSTINFYPCVAQPG